MAQSGCILSGMTNQEIKALHALLVRNEKRLSALIDLLKAKGKITDDEVKEPLRRAVIS
jgi:hypothetical protein